MGIRKLAFLFFFFACHLLSARLSFNILVSASMHEEVKEESMKLSVHGARDGGGGARGGSSGHGGRGGGKGGSSGYRRRAGRGSYIPIYAGGTTSAHNYGHHHSAANCQTCGLFFVTMGAAIMASVSLSF